MPKRLNNTENEKIDDLIEGVHREKEEYLETIGQTKILQQIWDEVSTLQNGTAIKGYINRVLRDKELELEKLEKEQNDTKTRELFKYIEELLGEASDNAHKKIKV